MVTCQEPHLGRAQIPVMNAAMNKLGVKRYIRIASAPFGVLDDGETPALGQRILSGIIKALMAA